MIQPPARASLTMARTRLKPARHAKKSEKSPKSRETQSIQTDPEDDPDVEIHKQGL